MVMLKDRVDFYISGKEMPAKIEINFGDCDKSQCMAYNPSLGKCMMMEGNKKV
jgi:hypothetical protein